MVEIAIRDLLLADTTVSGKVGTRIYPVVLPTDCAYPAITYQLISDTSSPTLTSTGQQQKRVQIDCWSKTYLEAKQLQTAVRAVLDGFAGALSDGTLIQNCQHDNAVDFFEDSALVHRAMSDYILQF
jgi:hypothetical protein